MWPFVSKMTPEPCPLPALPVTEMATTLGETTPAAADQFGADGLAWSTGDDEVVALTTVCAAGDDPTTLGSGYQFAMSRSTTQVTPRGVAVGPLNDVAVGPLKDLACLDGVSAAVVADLEPGAAEGTVARRS
jgi:hypothetical protein